MRKRPFISALAGVCIVAMVAVVLGVPNGFPLAYADGGPPEPPKDPAPPPDTTVTSVNLDAFDQEDGSVIIDPKQEVSLQHIVQLFVIGII